ncbi:hypothetical protein EDB89DRAFT_2023885 [Lactarius sanguifluus]|nr:hypothetical protein EDB89DRAFT_2023885 [Lactarius sanguifluus]
MGKCWQLKAKLDSQLSVPFRLIIFIRCFPSSFADVDGGGQEALQAASAYAPARAHSLAYRSECQPPPAHWVRSYPYTCARKEV